MTSFPDHYGTFLYELGKKLERGQQLYGSSSFKKSEGELLEELQQEAVDLAGWGYILWAKIEALKSKPFSVDCSTSNLSKDELRCRCGKSYMYVWDDESPTGKTLVEVQNGKA